MSGQSFTFEGRSVPFRPGQSVGAAVWAAGDRTLRTTRGEADPRGLFCGIGICHDCLVVIDDVGDQRACITPAEEGMVVRVQQGAVPPPAVAAAGHVGPGELLTTEVVVIGGGPAGMAAAAAATAGGAKVVLLDAEARVGGQYWRHGPHGLGAQHHAVEAFTALRTAVDGAAAIGLLTHRPRHRVWRVDPEGGRVVVHAVQACGGAGGEAGGEAGGGRPDGGGERPVTVAATAVVIATGAHDTVLPFPGWDLPGVLAAGGAQALLKEHQVLPGRRVVVAGTGPFLLSLAAGLAQAGAEVAAVFEAGDGRGWARRWRSATAVPRALIEGAQYAATLARQRIPVRARHIVVAARGRDRLEAVEVARLTGEGRLVPGSARWVRADALAVGWGFTPRLELAQQAGCTLGVSHAIGPAGAAAVVADAEGRTGVPGVYVAGEVGGIGGAPLAQVTGRLAGSAAAAWVRGVPSAPDGAELAERRRLSAFAATMHAAHPVPPGWVEALTPSTIVCRCEEVPADRLRHVVRELGATDPRTAKLLSRCGMGWCQGRVCGTAVDRLVADVTGRRPGGFVDARPVAAPVRLASLLDPADTPRPS
ncbi:MAG: FAD-dependent oxidoreductase [Kineosporiaceae bacterium]|nr:FAD-dependent oxidoreductase [Kineosporiaceae bacterium]